MAKRNNRVKTTGDLELKDRLVAINRVTKVTKGGRTFTFAAIVVVGNENGIVGWALNINLVIVFIFLSFDYYCS